MCCYKLTCDVEKNNWLFVSYWHESEMKKKPKKKKGGKEKRVQFVTYQKL